LQQWIRSANCAIEGILYAAKTQRHVRYHLYAAIAVLILSYILGIKAMEFLIIALTVIVVIIAELFNTAIEDLVDLLSPEHSLQAKAAKDVAAGAVFITAFGSLVIGYKILFPAVLSFFMTGLPVAKHTREEVALISFILVLILVVIAKAYFGKGTPLSGGLPSGHSAISFSVWVAVSYITRSYTASLLCLLLALVVSVSRITTGVHSAWEVFLGALLGASITFLLFLSFL